MEEQGPITSTGEAQCYSGLWIPRVVRHRACLDDLNRNAALEFVIVLRHVPMTRALKPRPLVGLTLDPSMAGVHYRIGSDGCFPTDSVTERVRPSTRISCVVMTPSTGSNPPTVVGPVPRSGNWTLMPTPTAHSFCSHDDVLQVIGSRCSIANTPGVTSEK